MFSRVDRRRRRRGRNIRAGATAAAVCRSPGARAGGRRGASRRCSRTLPWSGRLGSLVPMKGFGRGYVHIAGGEEVVGFTPEIGERGGDGGCLVTLSTGYSGVRVLYCTVHGRAVESQATTKFLPLPPRSPFPLLPEHNVGPRSEPTHCHCIFQPRNFSVIRGWRFAIQNRKAPRYSNYPL